MKYEYYVIAFKNNRTGEIKEYYQFTSPEDIEDKAKDLKKRFFDIDEPITILIYKQIKAIYDEE